MITATSVKLSKETLSILKNFSAHNSNLLVKPGNEINTITPAKNVVAKATVQENFPVEFGIWDLNKFLGTISLFNDPEFTFDEKCVHIEGEDGARVAYYYSEPRLLSTLTKEVKMPEAVVNFSITEDNFVSLQRAASVLQLPDLCIRSNDNNEIELVVLDKKSATSNQFAIVVGDNEIDANFEFYLKMENIRLLAGNYDVSVSKSVVSKFSHQSTDLVYYIALENDSTFTEV
jgi:hypothetical protein